MITTSAMKRLRIDPAICIVFGLVILLVIFGYFISDRFGTIQNLTNILENSVSLGLSSLGQTLVILTGGIDLSIGGVINLTSCLTSGIINGDSRLVVPVITGVLLLGILIGFINGSLTVWLGVHPLIVTLGMSMILQGITLMYTLAPPGAMPLSFDFIAYGRVFGVPFAPVVLVLIFVIMGVFLRKTKLGRHVYAVGGNAEAARLSGIRQNRVVIFVYSACGFFAALTGVYLVSRMGIGDPRIGEYYMLSSITPVVVGGTILAGGKGGVLGTLIGVFLIILLRNLLNFMDITSFYQWIIEGLIIIIAVSFYIEKRKL
ncbi:MAG: ABC transporter permease [Deltaproteobacteria bacterium]|jgi:ribose transport system permease protein|nr:ABC transporter permease [Deltaproteobacteria bacterium]